MSKIDKILFIRSYWKDLSVYDDLETYSEKELDFLISSILSEVNPDNEKNAVDHIASMPVFLN